MITKKEPCKRPLITMGWPYNIFGERTKWTLVRASSDGIPFWGTTFKKDVFTKSHYIVFEGETQAASGTGQLVEMDIVNGKPLMKVQSITIPKGIHYTEELSTGMPCRCFHPDVGEHRVGSLDQDSPRLHTQYFFSKNNVISFERWLELSQQAQSERELRQGQKAVVPNASDLQAKVSLVYPWQKVYFFPMRSIQLFHHDGGRAILPGFYRQVLRVHMDQQGVVCHVLEDRCTFARVTYAQC